jgi:hypothetical protein
MRRRESIHERPGWPDLTFSNDVLASLMAAVRHRQGRLLGQMAGLGFDLQSEASLTTLTTDVVKSSAIEGEKLNPDEVRSSIAARLGLDTGGPPRAGRDVEGIVEMMLDATQRYDEPLSAERLLGWHAALFPTGRSGMRRITVGGWRTGSMQVVSGRIGNERIHFEAPSARVGPSTESGRSLALQNDGKIVMAGIEYLVRLTTSGALDTTFNGVGYVNLGLNASSRAGVAIQPNGRIVVVGTTPGTAPFRAKIQRFWP